MTHVPGGQSEDCIVTRPTCCVLNGGPGAWVFEELARQLAAALWVDVSDTPREFNYLLSTEMSDSIPAEKLFIPPRSVELASDKRLLAEVFSQHDVPTPETLLVPGWEEVQRWVRTRPDSEWCLKYPLACGASGHRLLTSDLAMPPDWPRPFVVQEFIRLPRPEVFRTYGADGELFGWMARRFPVEKTASPWVAHARGARYERGGELPRDAVDAARSALRATGLLGSFGCVDLLRRPFGEWVVLEVGTDGVFNHVDRDLGDPELEEEIQRRIATAFWARAGVAPWGKVWAPKQ
jgi:hypothetical protein